MIQLLFNSSLAVFKFALWRSMISTQSNFHSRGLIELLSIPLSEENIVKIVWNAENRCYDEKKRNNILTIQVVFYRFTLLFVLFLFPVQFDWKYIAPAYVRDCSSVALSEHNGVSLAANGNAGGKTLLSIRSNLGHRSSRSRIQTRNSWYTSCLVSCVFESVFI